MKFMNRKMRYFYEHKIPSTLSLGLSELICNGIVVDQGFFLFRSFHDTKNIIDKKWVKEIYIDETGFECSVNSFHLEDYYDRSFKSFEQVANIGFELMTEFGKYWDEKFEEPCVAILTISLDTEFAPDAVFRFHKKREKQYWIDPNEIENSSEAVMIIEIGVDRSC